MNYRFTYPFTHQLDVPQAPHTLSKLNSFLNSKQTSPILVRRHHHLWSHSSWKPESSHKLLTLDNSTSSYFLNCFSLAFLVGIFQFYHLGILQFHHRARSWPHHYLLGLLQTLPHWLLFFDTTTRRSHKFTFKIFSGLKLSESPILLFQRLSFQVLPMLPYKTLSLLNRALATCLHTFLLITSCTRNTLSLCSYSLPFPGMPFLSSLVWLIYVSSSPETPYQVLCLPLS